MIVLAVLLVWWALREARALDRGKARALFGPGLVVLLALVVRWCAPSVPFDVNDRLLPARRGLLDAMESYYGEGMIAWAGLLFTVFPGPDSNVYHAGVVAGAAMVAALMVFMARSGATSIQLVSAGVVAAVTPMLVRFSHTDVQVIPEMLLFWVAMCALQRVVDRDEVVSTVVAGLALGVAMTMRPEAPVIAGMAAAWVVWVAPAGAWRRRSVVIVAVLAGLLCLPHLLLMGEKFAYSSSSPMRTWDLSQAARSGFRYFVFLNPEYTPVIVPMMALVGAVFGRAPRALRVWLVVCLLVASCLVPAWSAEGGKILLTRHQLRALPFVAVLAGYGVEALVRTIPWAPARWGVAGVGLAMASLGLPIAWLRTAENVEYSFFVRALPSIPDGCTVQTLRTDDWDNGLDPLVHYSEQFGLDHRWTKLVEAPSADCVIYYRQGNCFAGFGDMEGPDAQGRAWMDPRCEAYEAAHVLRPILETEIPIESLGLVHFAEGRRVIGFYEVDSAR